MDDELAERGRTVVRVPAVDQQQSDGSTHTQTDIQTGLADGREGVERGSVQAWRNSGLMAVHKNTRGFGFRRLPRYRISHDFLSNTH